MKGIMAPMKMPATISGSVSVSTYVGQDGKTRASLEVTADDVEFLSPKEQEKKAENVPQAVTKQSGFVEVEGEELPF